MESPPEITAAVSGLLIDGVGRLGALILPLLFVATALLPEAELPEPIGGKARLETYYGREQNRIGTKVRQRKLSGRDGY
jgi:hypothetical protein